MNLCVFNPECVRSSFYLDVQGDPEVPQGDHRGVMSIQWFAWIPIQHFFLPVEWVCASGGRGGEGLRMEGSVGGPDAPPRTVACLGDILLYMPI